MNNLPPEEWRKHLEDDDTVILDVRTPQEHEQEVIPNSVLLNIQESESFIEEVQKLDRDKKYMVYCHAGGRSAVACKLMQQFGFTDVHNLDGGITEWKDHYETH